MIGHVLLQFALASKIFSLFTVPISHPHICCLIPVLPTLLFIRLVHLKQGLNRALLPSTSYHPISWIVALDEAVWVADVSGMALMALALACTDK